MGKSSPDDEVCKQTPRSADPVFIEKEDIKQMGKKKKEYLNTIEGYHLPRSNG